MSPRRAARVAVAAVLAVAAVADRGPREQRDRAAGRRPPRPPRRRPTPSTLTVRYSRRPGGRRQVAHLRCTTVARDRRRLPARGRRAPRVRARARGSGLLTTGPATRTAPAARSSAARSARSSPAGSATAASGACFKRTDGCEVADWRSAMPLLPRPAEPDRMATRTDRLPIGIDDVHAAAERLRGVAHRTPVLTSRTLDERCGGRVFLKAENFQRDRRVQVPRRLQRGDRARARARRGRRLVGQPRPGASPCRRRCTACTR